MIINVFLWIITLIVTVFVALLPDASIWPLPQGLTDGLEFLGDQVASLAAILPDNTLNNLVAALTLVITANLLVIPWLAARGFRLPFAAMTKRE